MSLYRDGHCFVLDLDLLDNKISFYERAALAHPSAMRCSTSECYVRTRISFTFLRIVALYPDIRHPKTPRRSHCLPPTPIRNSSHHCGDCWCLHLLSPCSFGRCPRAARNDAAHPDRSPAGHSLSRRTCASLNHATTVRGGA